MTSATRLVFPFVIVVVAIAIVVAVIDLIDPALASDTLVRIALGICGVGFLLASGTYARDGYRIQAAGHGLAGVGFILAASGTEGTVIWVGVLLLGGGGVILFRDAMSGTDAQRPNRGREMGDRRRSGRIQSS